MSRINQILTVFIFLLTTASCKKTEHPIELSGRYASQGKMYYKGDPVMYTASGKITDSAIINTHVNRTFTSMIVPGFTNPFKYIREDNYPATAIEIDNNKGMISFDYYGSFVTSSMTIEGSGAERIISLGPVSNSFNWNSCSVISDEIISPKPVILTSTEWQPGLFNQTFTFKMPLLVRNNNLVEMPVLLRWVSSGSSANCFSIRRSHHNIDPFLLTRLNVKDTVILQEAYISLIKQ
jgi:hypothetical protein